MKRSSQCNPCNLPILNKISGQKSISSDIYLDYQREIEFNLDTSSMVVIPIEILNSAVQISAYYQVWNSMHFIPSLVSHQKKIQHSSIQFSRVFDVAFLVMIIIVSTVCIALFLQLGNKSVSILFSENLKANCGENPVKGLCKYFRGCLLSPGVDDPEWCCQ